MRSWTLSFLAGAAALAAGCAVISSPVRHEALPLESFSALREAPEGFSGGTVILGGELIETRNQADGTVLLVLERPLGLGERPETDGASGGRFMVHFAEYLDPVLFAPSRLVTVAGKVRGTETEAVGEAPYRYVLLEGVEIHLWKEPAWLPNSYWGPYDPWYPWWYDPRYGQRPWWW
ncbi:MAG: Slp/YeaY family lipoprotein [Proteobacteria bacterium]|nr:Slp/YeaY family lipoprotein [Pseudomonadota bacterium]